jgi:KDO2-lipid IV(A) lauroyltransferase
MTGNWALYVALRIAGWTLPVIPVRAAHSLSDFAGKLAFFLFPKPREAVLQNLSVVMATSPSDPMLRPLAIEAFRTDAKNWIDTLRIRRASAEEIESQVEIDHWERFAEAASEGKGVVLATVHLGNYDTVGQVLAERGYRMTVPVERMQPQVLFDFLVDLRMSKGIIVVPLDRAPRELLRALRNGEIVGLAADRDSGGHSSVVTSFFGRPTALPRGPVSLARRTGAPLLLAVGIRRGDDTFFAHVRGPIPVTRTENAKSDDLHNIARLTAEMETLIRRYPGQWLNFSPMWKQPVGADLAATMKHQTGEVL